MYDTCAAWACEQRFQSHESAPFQFYKFVMSSTRGVCDQLPSKPFLSCLTVQLDITQLAWQPCPCRKAAHWSTAQKLFSLGGRSLP